MATRLSQYRTVGPALVEHREVPRHRVTITHASLSDASDGPTEAVLHDISLYGCRFAGQLTHEPGTQLNLQLADNAPIAATVIWNDGGYLGCRFDAPIDRALMRSLTLVLC